MSAQRQEWKLVKRLTIKVLLGLCFCTGAPARGDEPIDFVKITCIPEARYIEFESKTIDQMQVLLDAQHDDRLRDERLAVWRKGGFFQRPDFPFECKLPEATYRIEAADLRPDDTGMCDPPLALTLLRNGEPILDRVVFGPACGDRPSIRSVAISDGLSGWDTRQMFLCLLPDRNSCVFLSETYQAISKSAPIDQADIVRYVTEKAPPEGAIFSPR